MTQISQTAAEIDCSHPLRLVALDAEDLAVISAHVQDSLTRLSEIVLLPHERRFALIIDRFDWCAAQAGRLERRRAGLHFDNVIRAMRHGLPRREPEAVLNLLSVSFTPDDAPGGVIELTFSGGAAIRLEVECVDAQMRDMGPSRPVAHMPGHDRATAGVEP